MNISSLPIEVYVVLGGIAVVITAILLLRFGKLIARALLVAAILTIVLVGLLALLTQASANRQTAQAAIEAAEAAKAANVGLSLSTLIIGGLVIILLAVTIGAGYLWVRLQLGKSRHQAQRGRWQPGPNALWGRQSQGLGRYEQPSLSTPAQQLPIYYLVEDDVEPIESGDFGEWGW